MNSAAPSSRAFLNRASTDCATARGRARRADRRAAISCASASAISAEGPSEIAISAFYASEIAICAGVARASAAAATEI